MSNFKETITKNITDIEFSNAPASATTLHDVQQKLGCIFGTQLKSYLLEFGYLACGPNEMYGVNDRQKMESDLVKVSEMLHLDFSKTKAMVAVDNQGDGDYILCDSNDMVYEFIPSDKDEIIPLNQTLLEYILNRLGD